METIRSFMPFVIALLTFGTVAIIVLSLRPADAAVKIYRRINNRLQEAPGGVVDYEEIANFLMSHGAAFHIGKRITPLRWLFYRGMLAVVLFSVGMYKNPLVAIVLLITGFLLPKLYLIRADHNDNDRMTDQLQSLYGMLQEQIMAGVYVTDALAEAYRGISHVRLRCALEELAGEILLKKSFAEAMRHFNAKFNSSMIDSLCVILVQAQESGRSAELLKDMSEQLKDLQTEGMLKKKERLDRIETVCILGIIAVVIGLVIYSCVLTMLDSVTGL